MRKRYIPNYYQRNLLRKLHGLTQGSMSVEEYHKEMELAMMRDNLEEDPNIVMAKFINGLNQRLLM